MSRAGAYASKDNFAFQRKKQNTRFIVGRDQGYINNTDSLNISCELPR